MDLIISVKGKEEEAEWIGPVLVKDFKYCELGEALKEASEELEFIRSSPIVAEI